MQQSKQCEQCGTTYDRPPHRSAAQWERMRFCSAICANTWRAQQQAKLPSTLRREGERWARWWERQRRKEDRADLRASNTTTVYGRGAKPLSQRPRARRFTGRWCQACGIGWLNYGDRVDAIYCTPCNRARWRETHYARAQRYGARFDIIDPTTIFNRDYWRCQLCGVKTVMAWPHPRRATIDHIVPLARGGDHTVSNLQCACWTCNVTKGARAANDQLLLEV